MKYTRLELRSSLSKNSIKNIIVFFTLIPVISICVGKLITWLFIIPYVSKNIQPLQYTVNIENNKTSSEYYLLQAGVFMNGDNAEILCKGISEIYNGTFILKRPDSFRVIVDISENKADLEKIQDNLKTSGYNCIISSFDFNSSEISNQVSDNIKSVLDLFENENGILIENTEQREPRIENITNQRKKIETVYNNLKSENNGDSCLNEYERIIDCTNEFIKNSKTGNLIEAKKNMSDQLFSFKNIFDNYSGKY